MQELTEILQESQIKIEEPMKEHTTFRIGGAAKFFLRPDTKEELRQILSYCQERKLPYFLLGNGSNLLVSDAGFDGVVVQLGEGFRGIAQKGEQLTVKAGTVLGQVAKYAEKAGLGGLEFASGIPGTIGGAVFMNAGAYGGEMKQIVKQIQVMRQDGSCCVLEKEELEMGYRTSIVKEKGYIVLETVLELCSRPSEEIQRRMEELKAARKEKQPLEFPSAGSTFKRPEGYFAGKLIMDAGLRGFRVGDAQIAEKHCGFVINRGNASAADVMRLVEAVKEKVKQESGVQLELEIQTLGFDS